MDRAREHQKNFFEFPHRLASGGIKSVEVHSSLIHFDHRDLLVSIVHDITERKIAEKEIATLALRNATLLQTAGDGIHVLSEQGEVREVNDTFCAMLGYTREELTGMNVAEWDAQWSRHELIERIGDLVRQPAVFETVHRRKDGTLRDVEINAVGMELEGERFLYASARDITDRKRTDEALRNAQKLESIGTLAGGIAHDFNNLLVGILGQASLAESKVTNGHPAHTNIRTIITASERAADLTRQLLAYSGKGKFFTLPMDLNALIRESIGIFQMSIPKSAEFTFHLNDPAPVIRGDTGQVHQVVMNLVINAGESLGDVGGSLSLRTGITELTEQQSHFSRFTNVALEPGPYAYIEVSDTGCGMTKEVIDRIFDPFYSTKFTGRGLGLAAVLGIIRSHKGGLSIFSEPGFGTTFRVVLPLTAEGLPVMPVVPHPLPSHRLEKHILVIDDDYSVVEFLREALGEEGCSVVIAMDPGEGIELFRSQRDFDLVILDYSMPGMNGRAAFQQLRGIDPSALVLISSGYTEEEILSSFGEHQPAGFFQKPYKADDVREKVRSIFHVRM